MNDQQILGENVGPQHVQSRIGKLKNPKALLLILLAASVLLLVIFQLYGWITRDNTPPALTCPEDILDVSIAVTDEELLAGVTASDNKDGDLSSDIVVESLSAMNSDYTRDVTYAVMDLSGNVSRAARTIHYTDYERPRILLDRPLRISKRDEIWSIWDNIHASSVLDGDLSAKFKYSFLDGASIIDEGSYAVELRVNDSTGTSTVIPTTLELYDARDEMIYVGLKEYLIYLHVGDAFVPEDYFGPEEEEEDQPAEEGADSEEENGPLKKNEELFIDSNVDTSVPGVYHVTYTVENETAKTMGKSRLIVVVE